MSATDGGRLHQQQLDGSDDNNCCYNIAGSNVPVKSTFQQEDPSRMMPGYTGHVPGIKFMYGVSYGEATSRSLANSRRRSLSAPGSRLRSGSTSLLTIAPASLPSSLRLTGAISSQTLPMTTLGLDTPDRHELNIGGGHIGSNNGVFNDGRNSNVRTPIRDSILGYTGYIPGLPFKYGETYGNATKECKRVLAASFASPSSCNKNPPASAAVVPNHKRRSSSVTSGAGGKNGTRATSKAVSAVINSNIDHQQASSSDHVKSTGRNNNLRPLRPLRPIVTEEECRKRVLETVRASDAQRRGSRPNRTVLRQTIPAACRTRPPSPSAAADGIDPITGYTGHIPHLSYVMGKPYCVAKEECLREFKRTLYLSSSQSPSRAAAAAAAAAGGHLSARSTPDIPMSPGGYSTASSEESGENSITGLRVAPTIIAAAAGAKSRV